MSRKNLATYILAAGLLTSVIVVVLPMATAQFPMKYHRMANITGSVNVRGNGQVLHTSEGFPLKSLGLMHGGGLGGNWNDHIRGGMWLPQDGAWKINNQTVK